jgi:CheY-like chemotaxis protein
MATVMIVEDNEDMRDMMALALKLVGIVVTTASNGREALAIMQNQPPPCLILLDLMMPVMDGWELRAALSQDPRLAAVPVIVVSALTREPARDLGAAHYLAKPVDLDKLVELVCEHCC